MARGPRQTIEEIADETEGRALYRARAEAWSRALAAMADRVLSYRPADKGVSARKARKAQGK
jgi:hypothetical protein